MKTKSSLALVVALAGAFAAASVSMVAQSKGTYKGAPFSGKSSGVDFFVKRDGRWQAVNSQMTTIKQ